MKFKNLAEDDHFVIASDSSNGGKLFQKTSSSEARRIFFENRTAVRTRELITVPLDAEVSYINMESSDRRLGARPIAAAPQEQQTDMAV
ncbi:MAG TPA: hypothetical protein VHC20_03530 [Candidatus Paceibacterota bacterium]|nr:hypothetical protein [Candidatus Paceibacterota bacterium]